MPHNSGALPTSQDWALPLISQPRCHRPDIEDKHQLPHLIYDELQSNDILNNDHAIWQLQKAQSLLLLSQRALAALPAR